MDSDLSELIFDIVELEWFDDRFDLFHSGSLVDPWGLGPSYTRAGAVWLTSKANSASRRVVVITHCVIA
jgi:hypothetical protein